MNRNRRTQNMRLRVSTSTLAMVTIGLAGCGAGVDSGTSDDSTQSGADGTLTWKSAWYVGPGQSTYDHGAITFQETLEEESEGKIKVELYPSQQLGAVTDSLTLIESGVADEAFTASSYHEDVIPMVAAFDMPYGLSQDQVVEARWAAAHEEGPFVDQLKEAGLVPLVVSATPTYEISTTKSPIAGLDDLQGLQIRVSTPALEKGINLSGGTGVIGPSSELFEMLERGVVDGTVFHYGSFDSSGIDGIMRHGTSNLHLPPTVVGSFVTQERWDQLSEEQQRQIYVAAREASGVASDAILQEVVDELPGLEEKGLQLYEWADEDVDGFYADLDEVTQEWISANGEKGQAAVDQAKRLGEAGTADDHSDLLDDFESFQF